MRVVIADDAGDMRRLVRLLLERDGRFEVVAEAADGAAAVEATRRTRPDAVVLDLMMPEVSGFDALPQMQVASPGVAVIVLSAVAEIGDTRQRVEQLGADALVAKHDAVGCLADVVATAVVA